MSLRPTATLQPDLAVAAFLSSPYRVVNIVVDSFFMADLLLNMLTVHLVRGALHFDQSTLVAEYLRG